MASNLAKYIVQLEAQTARYQRDLDRAEKKLKRFHRSNKSALSGITKQFLALAPAVSAVGFIVLARQSIDTADKLNKLTDRLGGSTEAFSELAFVAERSGVNFQTLALGLQRMSRRIAEASVGTGEAKDAIRELGLDAAKLAKIPIDKQFEVVAQRLFEVESASQKTRLAMKLFDSEGVALLQTMKNGAAGIDELRKKAQELGITLDQDAAAKATEAKDAMTDFGTRMEAVSRNLTLAFVPSLVSGIEKLEAFTIGLREAFGGVEATPLDQKIADAQKELTKLQNTAAGISESKAFANLFTQEEKDRLLNDILDVSKSIEALKKERLDALDSDFGRISDVALAGGAIKPGLEADTKALDSFRRKFETTAQAVERQLKTLESFRADLTVEEFERIKFAIESALIQPIEVLAKKKPGAAISDQLRQIREAAELANQQARELGQTFASAFEDAIIEGEKFRDVLAAMLKDLARIALRRGITEPFVNAFSSFITGKRAAGGPVTAGGSYLVGERGPEVFVPQGSGTIVPNNRVDAGGLSLSYTIDARGADEARILRVMPAILQEAERRTIQTLVQLRSEGQLSLA